MVANIGRISSETREARKGMIAAEEINELSLEDMVQKVDIDEEVCYIVKFFTTESECNILTEQGMMTASVRFTIKVDCHNSKRNITVYLRYYLKIDSNLRNHTMDETTLIQNTVGSDHNEAVAEISDVFQAEISSEAESRTNELLTNITSVCRQALKVV
ncbi:hypothetical protein RMATCC62417_16587 [Rhizopus microsporus]|nr:hypothetical protein RMATCC62417_16587 [Rhizopus microsporus]